MAFLDYLEKKVNVDLLETLEKKVCQGTTAYKERKDFKVFLDFLAKWYINIFF